MEAETALPILFAILLQTGMFVFWIGKLAERVLDLKADMKEIKVSVVYKDVYLVEISALKEQLEDVKKRCREQHVSLAP